MMRPRKRWLDEIRKDCEVLGLSLPVVKRFNNNDADDDDEIAYFTVRWKKRASFVYRTKNMR